MITEFKLFEKISNKGFYYKMRTEDPVVIVLSLKKLGFTEPELNEFEIPQRLNWLTNAGKKGIFYVVGVEDWGFFVSWKDLQELKMNKDLEDKGEIKISKKEIEFAKKEIELIKSMKKYNL